MIKSIKYIGSLLILGLMIVFGLSLYKNKDEGFKAGFLYFGILILKNLFLTSGIALTEFIFLTAIGSQYISADSNVIIKQILININKTLTKSK
jgi:hypothetical protein